MGGDFNLDLNKPRSGENQFVKTILDKLLLYKNQIKKGQSTHFNHLSKTPSSIDHCLVKDTKLFKVQLRDLPATIDDNHKAIYGFLPIIKKEDDFLKVVLSRRPCSKLKKFQTLMTCWHIFVANMNDKFRSEEQKAEKI
jgi:hypothetical protein